MVDIVYNYDFPSRRRFRSLHYKRDKYSKWHIVFFFFWYNNCCSCTDDVSIRIRGLPETLTTYESSTREQCSSQINRSRVECVEHRHNEIYSTVLIVFRPTTLIDDNMIPVR